VHNGRSKSSKVIDIYTNRKLSINFLLVINCNFGRILHRFRDFAAPRSKNRFLPYLPCFEAPYLPNPCEYLHNPYIARSYIQWTIFPPLTVWVYLHSIFCSGLRKTGIECIMAIQKCIMAVQGHPRSLIFTPIESSVSASY